MGFDALYCDTISLTFRKNVLPPFSRLKSNPSISSKQREHRIETLLHVRAACWLLGLLFDPEMETQRPPKRRLTCILLHDVTSQRINTLHSHGTENPKSNRVAYLFVFQSCVTA
jgi:hypothetical protein